MVDTINSGVVREAAIALDSLSMPVVHTVIIELSGIHGGVDVTVQGLDGDYNARTITLPVSVLR